MTHAEGMLTVPLPFWNPWWYLWWSGWGEAEFVVGNWAKGTYTIVLSIPLEFTWKTKSLGLYYLLHRAPHHMASQWPLQLRPMEPCCLEALCRWPQPPADTLKTTRFEVEVIFPGKLTPPLTLCLSCGNISRRERLSRFPLPEPVLRALLQVGMIWGIGLSRASCGVRCYAMWAKVTESGLSAHCRTSM